MNRARPNGFSLPEMLVSVAIVLVLCGAIAAVALPSHASARAQPGFVDLQQRMRATVETLAGDLRSAGSGPINGVFGQPLGAVVPTVLPYRIGARRADPPGTVREDAVTVISSVAGSAAAVTRAEFRGPTGNLEVGHLPGCPLESPSCGVEPGDAVLLIDASGQCDLFGVSSVAGNTLTIEPRGLASGRPYAAGSLVVRVEISTYYFRPAAGSEPAALARYDGSQSDLPLTDHLVALTFEYYGDPRPPLPRSPPGPRGETITYGPAPPLLDADDPRDTWGAGENCVISIDAGRQVPRLREPAAGGVALQRLESSDLVDGPWCPDAAAANRFDADLLRLRKVRVTLRLEASSDTLRGTDPRFFRRPGSAPSAAALVPDQQSTFEVVPRVLSGGR